MSDLTNRYRICKSSIQELSKQTPHKIWIGLVSVILATLLMLGPIVLLANCFIFNDYFTLVMVGFAVCLYFIIFLSRVFYYKTITKKQVEDMHIFYLFDSLVCLVGLLLGIVIGIFI